MEAVRRSGLFRGAARVVVLAIACMPHLLDAIIWVDGMFFAHGVLRPAAITMAIARQGTDGLG